MYRAASAAPARTEALLHQFLGQVPRTGLGAAVVPTSSQLLSAGSTGVSTGGLGGMGTAGGAGVGAAGVGAGASAAALRHAADLLAITADARRARTLGTRLGAAGAGDSTLALCRKQYYAGVVAALAFDAQSLVASITSPAARINDALELAIHNYHSLSMIEERYLSAAALLAMSGQENGTGGYGHGQGLGSVGCDDEESEVEGFGGPGGTSCSPSSAEAYGLMRNLCAVPLTRCACLLPRLDVLACAWA